MSDVFLYLLNQSLTAGYLILAVLAMLALCRIWDRMNRRNHM